MLCKIFGGDGSRQCKAGVSRWMACAVGGSLIRSLNQGAPRKMSRELESERGGRDPSAGKGCAKTPSASWRETLSGSGTAPPWPRISFHGVPWAARGRHERYLRPTRDATDVILLPRDAGFTTALLQDVIAHAACLHSPFAAAGSLSLQRFCHSDAASIETPKNPHEKGRLQRR